MTLCEATHGDATMLKHSCIAFGLLFTALAVSSDPAPPGLERFVFTEPHMGTVFKIVLYAPDDATAKKAARAAFERIAQLNRIMSDYLSTSELMEVCKKGGGPP